MQEEDFPAWKQHEPLFRAALGDLNRHALSAPSLAQHLSNALAETALFPREKAARKHVPQITLFAYLCAPRVGSARGLITATEFLSIVFLFNDYWPETGKFMLDGQGSENSDHRLKFVRSWLEKIERDYGDRAGRFLEAFRRWHRSLGVEQALLAQPGHPTLEEYVDKDCGRYQWVATPTYMDLWELVEGIEVPEEKRGETEPLKELAVELSYLSNDIGSIDQDGERKNYVRLMALESGKPGDLEAAIEETARVYREKAAEFMTKARDLENGSVCKAYAELVAQIANGNVRVTAFLAEHASFGRYAPTVRAALDRLLAGSMLAVA